MRDVIWAMIDMPAQILGQMFAQLWGAAVLVATIAAGVYASRYLRWRMHPHAAMALGWLIAIYVGLVLYRSQTWAAIFLIRQGTDGGD